MPNSVLTIRSKSKSLNMDKLIKLKTINYIFFSIKNVTKHFIYEKKFLKRAQQKKKKIPKNVIF
jgi:hypothetical protein